MIKVTSPTIVEQLYSKVYFGLRYLTESWGSGDQGRIEQRIIEGNRNTWTITNIQSQSEFYLHFFVHCGVDLL